MASARHQSDTVVKHWASPPASGNWFFCKSQRLGCERGSCGEGDGRRSEMRWKEGGCEKTGLKLMFARGVHNCCTAPRSYFLTLKSWWTCSGGFSASCCNQRLTKTRLSAQLEMWTKHSESKVGVNASTVFTADVYMSSLEKQRCDELPSKWLHFSPITHFWCKLCITDITDWSTVVHLCFSCFHPFNQGVNGKLSLDRRMHLKLTLQR